MNRKNYESTKLPRLNWKKGLTRQAKTRTKHHRQQGLPFDKSFYIVLFR